MTDKTIDLDLHRGMARKKRPSCARSWRMWRRTKKHCALRQAELEIALAGGACGKLA
jgi:hypothetical protein